MRTEKIVWGLVIFAILYRIFASFTPELSNTSPVMALCFGGGLLLGRRFWWVPAVLLLASDFLIGIAQGGGGVGWYSLLTITFFCGTAFLGSRFSGLTRNRWPVMWCGVLLSSVLFYAAANTFSWALSPGYAKTLAGWWQSQTTGLPQFSPPSWVFLRNALIADSLWCLVAGILFFFRRHLFPEPAPQPERAG